jgi:hypothetical protein
MSDLDLQAYGLRLCFRRRRPGRHRFPSSGRHCTSSRNELSHFTPDRTFQVSVYYLGTLVGCLIGGWVGDKIGRVRTIAFGAAWAIFGAALQCSAQNHIWMIFARLINGWGTGVLVSIVYNEVNVFEWKLTVAL